MLSFTSDCVVLAGKVWFGSIVIAVVTIAAMVAGLVVYGLIRIKRDDE